MEDSNRAGRVRIVPSAEPAAALIATWRKNRISTSGVAHLIQGQVGHQGLQGVCFLHARVAGEGEGGWEGHFVSGRTRR